ncbi:hypothetical protein DPMN_096194 [Dreissena polymorpha]|uniref:Uncharacterized protein n=1 Tax=Dreissena polymorpha TaxID=45954 RepID=A0A9D4LAP2_DREPO|nr:hypothetical protein DPMN_096194 [Dreissena polymorpha]
MFSLYTYREKCPAHWRPCFSLIWTIFELVRDINKTNVVSNFHDDWAKIVTSSVFTPNKLLTKFHEDRTINVASRVFTNKWGRMDGQRTKTGHKSSPEQSMRESSSQQEISPVLIGLASSL